MVHAGSDVFVFDGQEFVFDGHELDGEQPS
jgi:hypothetical protein